MPNQYTSDTMIRIRSVLRRRKRGLTVREIAERTGLTVAAVDAAVRRDEHRPRLDALLITDGLRRHPKTGRKAVAFLLSV